MGGCERRRDTATNRLFYFSFLHGAAGGLEQSPAGAAVESTFPSSSRGEARSDSVVTLKGNREPLSSPFIQSLLFAFQGLCLPLTLVYINRFNPEPESKNTVTKRAQPPSAPQPRVFGEENSCSTWGGSIVWLVLGSSRVTLCMAVTGLPVTVCLGSDCSPGLLSQHSSGQASASSVLMSGLILL